mmetsp:Transcript_37735/g.95424  ORF Transcript_37735/g.95424 Transcript_37735/m.95424 type:complete len:275 (+) Transcript_37735:1636-2460(+)
MAAPALLGCCASNAGQESAPPGVRALFPLCLAAFVVNHLWAAEPVPGLSWIRGSGPLATRAPAVPAQALEARLPVHAGTFYSLLGRVHGPVAQLVRVPDLVTAPHTHTPSGTGSAVRAAPRRAVVAGCAACWARQAAARLHRHLRDLGGRWPLLTGTGTAALPLPYVGVARGGRQCQAWRRTAGAAPAPPSAHPADARHARSSSHWQRPRDAGVRVATATGCDRCGLRAGAAHGQRTREAALPGGTGCAHGGELRAVDVRVHGFARQRLRQARG